MFILTYLIIFIFGVLIGNFVTPIFYRLPRNIMIFGGDNGGKPPHCGFCQHRLKFYEYLPILSWISAAGSCNYCGKKINPFYLYIELAGGFLAVACAYLFWGNIDLFFLKFCFSLNLILSMALYIEHKRLFPPVIAGLLFEAAMMASLQENTIINWLMRLSFVIIISSLLLQRNKYSKFIQGIIATILPAAIFLYLPTNLALFALIILINILISSLVTKLKPYLYISNSIIMLIFSLL